MTFGYHVARNIASLDPTRRYALVVATRYRVDCPENRGLFGFPVIEAVKRLLGTVEAQFAQLPDEGATALAGRGRCDRRGLRRRINLSLVIALTIRSPSRPGFYGLGGPSLTEPLDEDGGRLRRSNSVGGGQSGLTH